MSDSNAPWRIAHNLVVPEEFGKRHNAHRRDHCPKVAAPRANDEH